MNFRSHVLRWSPKTLTEANTQVAEALRAASQSGNDTSVARSMMEVEQLDPQSVLNVKLRNAEISQPRKSFADAFAIIANTRDFSNMPHATIEEAIRSSIDFALQS